MRNKKLSIIVTVLLLIVTGTVTAQAGGKNKKPGLKGIWQMCFYASETENVPGMLKSGNTFKVLSDDGKITNFTITPNRSAVITGYGTYEQLSDSTYAENIERSVHLPVLNSKTNILHYEFVEGGYMRIKFFIKEDEQGNLMNSWYHETWRKIDMPDKKMENYYEISF